MARQKMIRKQLYVLPSQAEMLKEKAAYYNISEGELVRIALDKYLSAPLTEGRHLDLTAWKKELEFIAKRASALAKAAEITDTEPAKERCKWKREDLYDR